MRYVFYVDVGSISPDKALSYIASIREQYKAKREQK